LDLGIFAIPLLLNALTDMPDIWFPLLRDITNENPVSPEIQGDYSKMTEAWQEWGRRAGHTI
jgi:hypothetical protein